MKLISLKSELSSFFRLDEEHKKALSKIGLHTIEDLMFYFPVRYGDTSKAKTIGHLIAGEKATIYGKIKNLKTDKAFRKNIPMGRATVEDSTGKINIVWFNQPYLAKMIPEESLVLVEGKVLERNGQFSISNPRIEKITNIPEIRGESLFGEEGEAMSLYPVYKETKGVTSEWIYRSIQKIFRSGILENITDPIPKDILSAYNLPSLFSALIWIHSPKNKNDAVVARKRFSFEEIFLIQLQVQKDKIENSKLKSLKLEHTKDAVQKFLKNFPFKLTEGQDKIIGDILEDFKRGVPMARLLEGDVGSGKTAVAATASFAVTENHPLRRIYDASERSFPKGNYLADGKVFGNFQVSYMAPTEILAEQHFKSFLELFKNSPVSIALITGSTCKKFPSKTNPNEPTKISKSQLTKWVANGEISILIGTHALIQKSVKFKNLAFVIIDEQHRFGTEQRKRLARKDGLVPHLLSMSATPIPRTLALTLYGDLDLSILDQMPSGRKPIITEIITPDKRENTYKQIEKELRDGRQLYVICPRIDEPDPNKEKTLNVKSVKEEAKRLKEKVFKNFNIGILHSKMTPKEKEDVMNDFKNKKIDILVATSVIEVGVNVPNATIIIIEGAERFGLSQLHQLRGRVIRGNYQAYCFVFAETKSDKTIERLKAFKNARDGFELAELDLKLRGAGELSGAKQWGVSDIGMEALQNIKMVEAARTEAKKLIEKDLELETLPHLREKMLAKKITHFE